MGSDFCDKLHKAFVGHAWSLLLCFGTNNTNTFVGGIPVAYPMTIFGATAHSLAQNGSRTYKLARRVN
jgi:hypothetical protein